MEGTFEWALARLKEGMMVTRDGWSTPDTNVRRWEVPDHDVNPCYLIRFGGKGKYSTWVPSVGDLEANDWRVV